MQLVYDTCAAWEKDYIQELFSHMPCLFVVPEQLKGKVPGEDKWVGGRCVLVFSSNVYTYDEILPIVIRLQPKIVVHLSDEWGTKPEYTQLALHTPLLLHQYHFPHYASDSYTHMVQIPLGYMARMFQSSLPAFTFSFSEKPIRERPYIWSFVGNIKQDRQALIDAFTQRFPDKETHRIENKISPAQMREIYHDSVFVPVGKGNVGLDCFRIYEAIFSGSIPVLVCSDTEFRDAFPYNGDLPPFLYSSSWERAADRCADLIHNPHSHTALEDLFQQNKTWLLTKLQSIQSRIHAILHSPPPPPPPPPT